jgi:hypothetical protein
MAEAGGGTRRRLTPEQQREVARLYGDTETPTTEIRERFGIAESSMYSNPAEARHFAARPPQLGC